MKRVVIESPYAGDVERNTIYAWRCLRWSLDHGEAPFAGHLLYTRVWDDDNPDQRDAGIRAHIAWIDACDLVVTYVDYGTSSGMQQAVDYARQIGKPVVVRAIGKNP